MDDVDIRDPFEHGTATDLPSPQPAPPAKPEGFDHTQYGSDKLSEEQRAVLLRQADNHDSFASWSDRDRYADRDALCSALREIDRLRAENERLMHPHRFGNDQRSTTDQLLSLISVGNRLGLYDAVDVVRAHLPQAEA